MNHNTFLQVFEYNYRKAQTVDLLETLRMMRVMQSLNGYIDRFGDLHDINRKARRQIGKMVVALKTELAKRPHIPNKKEKKELRRMAVQGRN